MGSEPINDNREFSELKAISKSKLQRHAYTVSLLKEGLRTGLLTKQVAARIQNRFMRILQELILSYTQGESTSVATDTAESLLASMMYAFDAYFHEFEEPEEAIRCLRKEETGFIYAKGVEKVSECLAECQQLYKEIRGNRLEVPVDAYNLTIDESLPVFLRKYGVRFDAHNTMASIDYPLAVDDMRLQGVYYIKQYMERLKLENEFCALFDLRELLDVLVDYGRACRFNYRIELFNLYELVMNQAVFSVLSGGEATHIRISASQFERLEQTIQSVDKRQLRDLVSEAMTRLRLELRLDGRAADYMDQCKEELVQRTAHAAAHNSLQAVIIAEKEAGLQSIVISFGAENRMSDAALRRILDEIAACGRKEDKIGLILSSFRSFHDYIDMLEADCLYGDEYDALFDAWDDMELAILAKYAFREELRSGALPSLHPLELAYPNEWQNAFAQYLNVMPRERLQAIDGSIHDIDALA